MKISYNWLGDYLPSSTEAEKLGRILTSLGLEVEGTEIYEKIKGGLKGLVTGEIIEAIKHPDADKLFVTKVNTGKNEILQIVCGAPNTAKGQKVIVALPGTTIYPKNHEPITIKVVKIRGIESSGMICAEDEIGLSDDHTGIIVLPPETIVGKPASGLFKQYSDTIFELGLTPNRMDAMSHLGVARDVCAYMSHHDKKDWKPKVPSVNSFKQDDHSLPFKVKIENKEACQRYSGVAIKDVTIKESPDWLKDKLNAIGVRPINNIVDITNFVLNESGQPLHAFDADEIEEKMVIVKNLQEGTPFITLDDKERKLSREDLMICDGKEEPMCIAGVFGGIKSGIKETTKNIFLESAWFNPVNIRKTSLHHNLRTDAALRFEKNIDISNTVNVLKRAALLIKEVTGGKIASEIIDEYPAPKEKSQIQLKYHFLRRISGKNYHPGTVKKILTSLGFEIVKEGVDDIILLAPYHKPDVSLPADIAEEIMRVDGYDNIEIPQTITITPSVQVDGRENDYRNKISGYLSANGFFELLTNPITNRAYYSEEELEGAVRMINSLSANLNIMRPSMLETGLESIVNNLNRKNNDLKLFEFGKTYSVNPSGTYEEKEHLSLYITGNTKPQTWKETEVPSDIFFVKAIVKKIFELVGMEEIRIEVSNSSCLDEALEIFFNKQSFGKIGHVRHRILENFEIRQPVYFADLYWKEIAAVINELKVVIKELPKQQPVFRDLALVVNSSVKYLEVENSIKTTGIEKLRKVELFDVFENEKIGSNKKSLAVSFTFLDEEKTLTDKEIDSMMGRIMEKLQKDIQAEIRK